MITIGVVEEHGMSAIIRMIKNLLINSNPDIKLNVVETLSNQSLALSNKLLKDYINVLEKNKTDIVIIKVIPKLIVKKFYEGIEFNVVVHNYYNSNYHNMDSYGENLLDIINNSDIAIINSDYNMISQTFLKRKVCIVTCGLNQKSTVTTSSMETYSEGDALIYCLQRKIQTIDCKILEPQEFPIKIKYVGDEDIFSVLAAVSVALICSVDTKTISDILL